MRISVLISLFFFYTTSSIGQSLRQDVIGTCGSSYADNGLIWSYTVGESVIETYTGSNVIINQGFHQTGIEVVNACDDQLLDVVKLYPNPASQQFTVETEGTMSYVIYNVQGMKVLSGVLSAYYNTIKVSGLVNGLYFMQVSIACHLKTYKIVVNNGSK